jgi:hypothetical protein
MWKKAVASSFKVLPQNLPWRAWGGKNSQGRLLPGQDSSRVSPEYTPEALPVEPSSSVLDLLWRRGSCGCLPAAGCTCVVLLPAHAGFRPPCGYIIMTLRDMCLQREWQILSDGSSRIADTGGSCSDFASQVSLFI